MKLLWRTRALKYANMYILSRTLCKCAVHIRVLLPTCMYVISCEKKSKVSFLWNTTQFTFTASLFSAGISVNYIHTFKRMVAIKLLRGFLWADERTRKVQYIIRIWVRHVGSTILLLAIKEMSTPYIPDFVCFQFWRGSRDGSFSLAAKIIQVFPERRKMFSFDCE